MGTSLKGRAAVVVKLIGTAGMGGGVTAQDRATRKVGQKGIIPHDEPIDRQVWLKIASQSAPVPYWIDELRVSKAKPKKKYLVVTVGGKRRVAEWFAPVGSKVLSRHDTEDAAYKARDR